MPAPELKRVAEFYDLVWRRGGSNDEKKRFEADAEALAALELSYGVRLLEIGVGMGENAIRAARAGSRVVAVDISEESLRAVGARARTEKLTIHRVRADAHRLPFVRNSFDRVAIYSVMMYLDPDSAFSEFARILDQGGRIALVEPVSGNPFMSLYRILTKKYGESVAWHSASALDLSLSRVFDAAPPSAYHLIPLSALLPRGFARSAVMKLERTLFTLFPLLKRHAWIYALSGTKK